MHCNAEPAASVALFYTERLVVIGDLIRQRDPNLLDLCDEHVARMTPPVGWTVRDSRTPAPALTS